MKRLTRGLLTGTVVAVVIAASSAAALAGGNPNKDPGTAPGNSANAPGQQKKGAQPPAPAQPAPAAAKPAKSEGAAAAKAKAKGKGKANGRSSSSTSASVFANPSGKARPNVPSGAVAGYQAHPESFGGPGNSGTHKYTVCHNGHAITVDVHSWNAHVNGHGDTLLPYGTKGKQACGSSTPTTPAPTPPTTPPTCPSTTTTVVGVWHHTGSSTNPFVLIHPSSNSAHMKGKHPEDQIATVTTTSTATCAPGSSSSPTSSATGAPTSTGGSSIAGATNGNANASTAAVAGATKTITSKRANRAAGVLGATKSAGNVLASAVKKGTLPFTGFPIWLAALIGTALIAGGIALRRARATTT